MNFRKVLLLAAIAALMPLSSFSQVRDVINIDRKSVV